MNEPVTEVEKDLKRIHRIITNIDLFKLMSDEHADKDVKIELLNIAVEEASMELKELYGKISGLNPWEVWEMGD